MRSKSDKNYIYVAGCVFNEPDEEGIILPKHQPKFNEVLAMSSVRRYYNCIYLLAGLTMCARILMDWISENMNESNEIRNTETDRNNFNKFLRGITKGAHKGYKDAVIKQAFGELSKCKLLLPRKRGLYLVNPRYFFSGSEAKRIQSVKMLIELGENNNTGVNKFTVTSIKSKKR